ncbi:MAG: acyl-CoA thioesterase [Rubrivivax sp.]|nr:acyl-CoA thioesterase [Rubrivivax sp.]
MPSEDSLATPAADAPQAYPCLRRMSTRWGDNDVYGHINNAVYYQYFDSVINHYLIHEAGLDIHDGSIVGFIVHSRCDYLRAVAYPADVTVGLRVDKLGNSSVTYALGLFEAGSESLCARASMVHAFVDTASSRPVPIPARIREALQRLQRPAPAAE